MCRSSLKSHRDCYESLEFFIQKGNEEYSDAVREKWLTGIKELLPRQRCVVWEQYAYQLEVMDSTSSVSDRRLYLNRSNCYKLPVSLRKNLDKHFDMDSKDRAVILLTGLPTLNSTLELGIHEPLCQQIVMNYEIGGLTKEEGRQYILDKLKSAGCNQSIFEDNAIEAVLNAADGTPRMISKLCNACLLIGDSADFNTITSDIVMKSVNDNEL